MKSPHFTGIVRSDKEYKILDNVVVSFCSMGILILVEKSLANVMDLERSPLQKEEVNLKSSQRATMVD